MGYRDFEFLILPHQKPQTHNYSSAQINKQIPNRVVVSHVPVQVKDIYDCEFVKFPENSKQSYKRNRENKSRKFV